MTKWEKCTRKIHIRMIHITMNNNCHWQSFCLKASTSSMLFFAFCFALHSSNEQQFLCLVVCFILSVHHRVSFYSFQNAVCFGFFFIRFAVYFYADFVRLWLLFFLLFLVLCWLNIVYLWLRRVKCVRNWILWRSTVWVLKDKPLNEACATMQTALMTA